MRSIIVPLNDQLGWRAKAGCCTSHVNPGRVQMLRFYVRQQHNFNASQHLLTFDISVAKMARNHLIYTLN